MARGGPGPAGGWTVLAVVALAVAGMIAVLPPLVEDPSGDGEVPAPPDATCAEPRTRRPPVAVTSSTLFACPSVYDGALVVVEGEAIGDLFDGPGDRRWVQVNDDAYAALGPLDVHHRTLGTNSGVAVLLPAGDEPTELGGPGHRGDAIRVIGTFQAASPADQGGPAVIAESVIPIRDGGPVEVNPSRRLRQVTPVAVVVTALIGAAALTRRRTGGLPPS